MCVCTRAYWVAVPVQVPRGNRRHTSMTIIGAGLHGLFTKVENRETMDAGPGAGSSRAVTTPEAEGT